MKWLDNFLRKIKEGIEEEASLEKEIYALKEKLKPFEEKQKEQEFADKINNKYTISPIIYTAREDKIKFDVRNFITPHDYILQNIVDVNKLTGKNNDETAFNCMKYVIDNFKWVSDSEQFGFKEHWDFPAEVLNRGKCDCEGGCHLIVSLMITAQIPSYRIKAACGIVDIGKERFGHSYPIYLRESDNEWVQMDWCVYPNLIPVEKRILAKANKVYKEIWFTFNDTLSWAQKKIEIEGGL